MAHIICGPVSPLVPFERVLTKSEKKKILSISDFPGVLRLPKRDSNVPTFDQLFRKEKLYLLRSCGYQCVEMRNVDPVKVIESAEALYGTCRYFSGVKSEIIRARILRKRIAAQKKAAHEQRVADWKLHGGQQRAYRSKHIFGCVDHAWFRKALGRATGMGVDTHSYPAPQPRVDEGGKRSPRARWNRESEKSDWSQRTDVRLEYQARPKTELFPKHWRSVMLLTKLRAYIRALRVAPMAVWNSSPVAFPPALNKGQKAQVFTGVPESDGISDELSQIKTGNVVLTEANPTSAASASSQNRFSFDWHQMCSTETDTSYDYLTNRFTLFKSYEWTTSENKGAELTSVAMALPCDFVNKFDGSMPMFVPFKIFKYYKSDIEIKIHVNSNKFQVGQLQFSWQYLEEYDGNKLDNIYSRSQLPHVVVNAGASNEATLYIPYKFVQPYVNTKKIENSIRHLYLGNLRCFVNSPLRVGANGPASCGFSIFIRFPNAMFTGMRDGSIGAPEMEGVVMGALASAAVNKMIGDVNCDNPSANVNPSYLVPTASHSWCAGTGLREQVQALRLDNTTIGVGRPGIDNSELSISIPSRVFGMLKHIEWKTVDKTANSSGYMLWSADAHAQIEKSLLNKYVNENAMDTYSLPPVSVIAGLYKQWRGSLEFKFDIIASQFHTGRLVIAYIPGFYGDASKITLEQARNSPHAEFSLQDATSFTFIVPFISDKVFWPRRYTGPHRYSEYSAPSKVVLFILNPLIPMESIVDHVVIIPYVRAGVDFEVSVPVQPSIGLSDKSVNTVKTKDLIMPTTGSTPYRATNYEGFGSDKKLIFYEGTSAFGTAATFSAPSRKLKSNEYFYGKAQHSDKQPVMIWKSKKLPNPQETRGYCGFIVLWNVPDKGNFGIPFPNGQEGEEYAKIVAKMLRQGKPTSEILDNCYDYIRDDADSSSDSSQLAFSPVFNSFQMTEIFGNPEMEDQRVCAPNCLIPTGSLPSTSGGSFNYNENFVDLKDLCRRYQLYADKTIKIPKGYSGNEVVASFPVIPHGLELDTTKPESMFNICRDGHIPIVSSGYIFFRGSLRFKLVLSADTPTLGGLKVWVQHHPDSSCSDRKFSVYPDISEGDKYKSHSYSFYLQAMQVNSIIEFEVPFYQSGMYGITRKPSIPKDNDICQYYSLGNLTIGFNGGVVDKAFDANIQVYYSIGDDFSFNIFRGFPMMCYTDEVWPVEQARKKQTVWITGEPEMEDAGDPEMFGSILSSISSSIFGGVVSTAVNTAVTTRISGLQKSFTDKLAIAVAQEIRKPLDEFVGTMHDSKATIINSFSDIASSAGLSVALGNLIHVFANPTPTTIAISVANVIVAMLSGTVISLVKMIELCTKIFTRFWHKFTGSGEPVGGAPEADDFDAQAMNRTFFSMVFSAVALLFGVSIKGPANFTYILSGINSSVCLVNNVTRLIQNSGDMINFCIKYIVKIMNPVYSLELELCDSIPEVKMWYEECVYLLDVRVKASYLYDKSMMSRVFDACVVGSLITAAGISKSHRAGKLIADTYKSLIKLRNDLFERGAHPDVRFETFPIWISGAPGIGKSYLVSNLCNNLLRQIQFQGKNTLIYYIPSGAKYWSGVQNPPVLVSDDLFQVGGTRLEDEIANIFLICSSSVLNPPMAAVEDKERRLNPFLYIMLCNQHYPSLAPTARCEEAIYRRRKFLIEADLTEEMKEKYPHFQDASDLSREERENFKHLRFRFANNPRVSQDATYSEWMTYSEMFQKVSAKFISHYEAERVNFRRRMVDMYCLDPDFEESNIIDRMPDLAQCTSLKDQIKFMKEYVQAQIDLHSDPNFEEPGIAGYVQKLKKKWADLRNHYQMEEVNHFAFSPGPSYTEPYANCNPVDASKPRNIHSESVVKMINSALNRHPDSSTTRIDTCEKFVQNHYPQLYNGVQPFHKKFMHFYLQDMDKFDHILVELNDPKSALFNMQYSFLGAFSNTLNTELFPKLQSALMDTIGLEPGEELVSPGMSLVQEVVSSVGFDVIDAMQLISLYDKNIRLLLPIIFPRPGYTNDISVLGQKGKALFDFNRVRGKRNFKLQHFGDYYANQKKDLRDSLDSVLLEENKHKMFSWLFFGIQYLLYTLPDSIISEASKDDIFDEICDYMFNDSFGETGSMCPWEAILTVLHVGIVERLSQPSAHYSDIVTTAYFKLMFEIYGLYLIGFTVFDPKHCCPVRAKYALLNKVRSKAKYCGVRGELTCPDGTVIKPCEYPHCIYSSPVFFGLECLSVKSCMDQNILFFDWDEFAYLSKTSDVLYSHEKTVFGFSNYSEEEKQRIKERCDRRAVSDLENMSPLTLLQTAITYSKPELVNIDKDDVVYMLQRKYYRKNEYNIFSNFLLDMKCYFYHKFPVYIRRLLDFISSYIPKICEILFSMGAMYGAYKIGQHISPKVPDVLCEPALWISSWFIKGKFDGDKQGNYFKMDAPKVAKNVKPGVSPKTFGNPQISSVNRISLGNQIERNTVLVFVTWIEDGVKQSRSCRCLALKGSDLLVLRHYIEEYQYLVDSGFHIELKLFFKKSTGVVTCDVAWKDFIANIAWCSSSAETATSNFGIARMPAYVPLFKDILKRFATYAEHKNVSTYGDLYVVNGDSSFGIPVSTKKNFIVNATGTSSQVQVDRVYSYNKHGKGMCGSMLVCPNLGSGLGAIIGVHIAGNSQSGSGFAEPVYKEMFDEFYNVHPTIEVLEPPMSAEEKPQFELDSNLLMYGCVPPTFAHKESGKSKIIPSMLHGEIYPVRTQVNPLRPNDPRQPPGSHPLRDGCNKHGTGDIKVFDPDLVEKVKVDLTDKFQQICRPLRQEIVPLTLQQTVCGDADVEYFEPLNWKSSEGFPLSIHRPVGSHDKKWLFDMTETDQGFKLNKLHDKLEQQMVLRDMCFKKNIKPPTVYVDCLKDYRLTPEKCAIPGKTRIFSIAPVQCSLDIRMHMNDFCASVKKHRINNGIGIGMNADSLEWTKLVNYLFEVGDKIITLDYSNYGPTLMSQLVAASSEVIVEWFRFNGASEEQVKRVEWLLRCDIINPVHLAGNSVYQTINGIASGSPLTGELNSLPNLFYIRLVFLEIMNEHCPEYASMYYFDAFVRLVVYGDDLIMSVSDVISSLFNSLTVRDALARHGIKVTPAQKDSTMLPYTSIYEATFLKRSFKEHPFRKGVWLGPIEKQSIEESINWVHASGDPGEALLEVCRASLNLAFSHGPEYFKNHYEAIRRKLIDLNLKISSKTWHEMDNEIFGENEQKTSASSIGISYPWTYSLSDYEL